MPVPAQIQSTDSITTWVAATNNLSSHVANTSVFVFVGNTAVGNVGINGTTTLTTLVVNTSSNIAGTNANVSANLFHTGTNATFTSNVTVSSTILTVSANTHLTGLFTNVTGYLRVANNAVFSNTVTVAGDASFTTNVAVTGTTTTNTISVLGGLVTNGTVTLSGPLTWYPDFVLSPTTLSGAGTQADLANNITGYSNAAVYRIASDQNKGVSGLYIVNATKYRQLTLMNAGDYNITLLHANTGSVANNRFLCPANTDFILSPQAAVSLIYDANTSTQRWRVLGATLTSQANNATYAYGKAESALNVNSAATSNNTTYAFGKSEVGLNVNSAATATTANNSTYAFGKSESGLNVNTAAIANNSTYAFGKSEVGLNVNSAATSNNSTYAFGKSESGLNVNSATTATTANNATFAFGKAEGVLSVNAATFATNAAGGGTLIHTLSSTGINASALSTGTAPTARLGAGAAANTTFLRGDSTWSALPALGTVFGAAGNPGTFDAAVSAATDLLVCVTVSASGGATVTTNGMTYYVGGNGVGGGNTIPVKKGFTFTVNITGGSAVTDVDYRTLALGS